MRARAPGKLLLSGAYSVLEGAEAIVTAVDRYVSCDASRPAERVTPEVEAALGSRTAPHFDASALRAEHGKLGLGSSAAILVASLAALEPALNDETALRQKIAPRALDAHRLAQGGGSGVDVLCSVWGGTSIMKRGASGELLRDPITLPAELCVEAWAASSSASTPELLARVRALAERTPALHADIMSELCAWAQRAAEAARSAETSNLIAAMNAQRRTLAELGRAAGATIITSEVMALSDLCSSGEAAILPSGAGGGDIVLWASTAPSPPEFRQLCARLKHDHVPLGIGARGVHQLPTGAVDQHGP